MQKKNNSSQKNSKNKVFKPNSLAPKKGAYVCVPCGYKQEFKKGAKFPSCYTCLKKEKYEGDNFFHGLELWEPADK